MKDNERLLSIAVEAARESASTLLSDAQRMRSVREDLYRDVKIEADFISNSKIIGVLSRETEYRIFSEEDDRLDNARDLQGHCWIIDPLDGSYNFSRNIPLCCISIALCKDFNPLLGVVYDFNRDELYSGIVGAGAWLNNVPIKVNEIREISKAVVCTGFPVGFDYTEEHLNEFMTNIIQFKKVRMIGSAALSLAYVACGRIDFYQESNIRIWDVVGGLAIVKAAGGVIECEHSIKKHSVNVRAANRFLLNKQ